MIRFLIGVVALIFNISSQARPACGDIAGTQAFSPLTTQIGVVCFVRQRFVDKTNGAAQGLDEIALYLISDKSAPARLNGRGLLIDDNPDEIVDAFVLHLEKEKRWELVIIQSVKMDNSISEFHSSGIFYSVSVFDQGEINFSRNERASAWFGDGYGWVVDKNGYRYDFPHKTRKSIRDAVNSKLSSLMFRDATISAIVRGKAFLYEGPNIQDRTSQYLVGGDHVTVDAVTAGWCKVNFARKGRPLQMWTVCNVLEIGK